MRFVLDGIACRAWAKVPVCEALGLRRDFKNVHADIQLLASVGILEFKRQGKRDAGKPVALYSGIDLVLQPESSVPLPNEQSRDASLRLHLCLGPYDMDLDKSVSEPTLANVLRSCPIR